MADSRFELARRHGLLRRGRTLEIATLAWNIVGVVVLAVTALMARSVALAGFGLDSLIEIGASTVVLWELSGSEQRRQRRALRLIAFAFIGLAIYLATQSIIVLAAGYHPRHSPRASPGPRSPPSPCSLSPQPSDESVSLSTIPS